MEVISVGQKPSSEIKNIKLAGLFDFKRLSLKRIFVNFRYFRFLIRTRPKVNIICTHELISSSVWYKIIFGGALIYDVQENYYRNLNHQSNFPPIVRNLIAIWVRLKEVLSRPFVDHYLLAEQIYEEQLGFTKNKSTVIANKFLSTSSNQNIKAPEDGKIRFLYSGTISKDYGIFEAIDLAKALHEIDPRIYLTIAGYSANYKTLEKTMDMIADTDFIHLIGGAEPVDYTIIQEQMILSDFALLPYRTNLSFQGKTPTKLYEYIHHKLPVVTTSLEWREFIEQYDCGIIYHINQDSPAQLLKTLLNNHFFKTQSPDLSWASEERKLKDVFGSHKKLSLVLK